jgi:hypothetical protein
MVIKGVSGKRRVAFGRLIVAKLNQVTLDRVNLTGNEKRREQQQPRQHAPNSFHRAFVPQSAAASKWI